MLASGCRGLRLAPRQLPTALKAPHICIHPPVVTVRGQRMTNHKWMSSHSAATTQTASDAKVNFVVLLRRAYYSCSFLGVASA